MLGTFINVSSNNEIDGRLVIGIEWSRYSDRDLNRIKEIVKL